MISGDYLPTAKAIGRNVNILHACDDFASETLLNFYDLFMEPEVDALNGDCLTRFISEWVEVITSYGISSQ